MSSDRRFNAGRQSEQLYNEELYKMYGSIKHLLEKPENDKPGPDSNLHGALWLDMISNELKYYNKDVDNWDTIFRDKFRVVDRLMNQFPPDRPVYGQLWINQGVLMYFDGSAWQPIKALIQDETQINLSVFEDFLMLSPILPSGNAIVNDENGIVDPTNKSQFLVPNVNVSKFFVNGYHKNDYEEVNRVTVQYPKNKLEGKIPSVVHVNPGKLTAIRKRLIKVDKINHFISANSFNTEFYGFRKGEHLGEFLRPGDMEDGDYTVETEGIMLSYNAAQNFDYILSVTYEFSWIKSSGRLNKTSTDKRATSFYVGGFGGPINVFVEGYDLENKYYYYDAKSKIVKIEDEDLLEDMEVSVMRSIKREYGLIRERTLDGKGIISKRNKYLNPLVFVNGQALHSSLGDVEIDDNIAYVPGGRRDMSYCVMELNDTENDNNMFLKSGYVKNDGEIEIEDFLEKVKEDEGIMLFVDGLLVKKEDVIRDYENSLITTRGLVEGQSYIILHDKYHSLLFDEGNLHSALVTGKVDESLVFMNDSLICNDTAIITTKTPEEVAEIAVHNEVKLFLYSLEDRMAGEFKVWDEYEKEWREADQDEIDASKAISFSYENSLHSITINLPYNQEDQFVCYAYNFANTIERPLLVNSITAEDEDTFPIKQHFIAGANSLQVFLNGVRQYRVVEFADGSGFRLPEKVTGKVTYIIEHPEGGAQRASEREILTYKNLISPNVYKTNKSLFPGRVTVYVSGLRQSKESYIILDNNTIMFKDKETRLIGTEDNYPVKTILKDKEAVSMNRSIADEILVEVRQEFERQERTVIISEPNSHDIDIQKYDLPKEILEASDEILIFINGVFAGLRDNLGYKKDRSKGAVTILDGDYVEMMNHDPLWKFLMINTEKYLEWKDRNGGKEYEPKINNKIILEWR